ncbi:hypothetical protein FQA39_LY01790 [Lamprigera yunnana]|nr:hypothetical protein FQA39_LY01790 [Lamprigera yunnana]
MAMNETADNGSKSILKWFYMNVSVIPYNFMIDSLHLDKIFILTALFVFKYFRLLVDIQAKKRRVLSQDAREIIWNVYQFHKNLNQVNFPDMIVKATGVSKSTVLRIIREGNAIHRGEIELFKISNKRMKTARKSSFDNCGEQVIRPIVHNFHVTEK